MARTKSTVFGVAALLVTTVLLAIAWQAARGRRFNISESATLKISLPVDTDGWHSTTQDMGWIAYWRSNTEAVLLQPGQGQDGVRVQISVLQLKGGGAFTNTLLPFHIVQKIQSGNQFFQVSPHGDYFLVVTDTDREHRVTEFALDGSVVGRWRSDDTLLDGKVFAPTGPGWVEFHAMTNGKPHGDYLVHYPNRADIRIKSGDSEGPELYSNMLGEIFGVETEFGSNGKKVMITYTGIWQNPGKTRKASLDLPADYSVVNYAANPVNADLLLLIEIPETPIFKNGMLRQIPFFGQKTHPPRTIVMRCKSDGTDLTQVGDVAVKRPLRYLFSSVELAWLPDGKRFSVIVGGNLYICNAYE